MDFLRIDDLTPDQPHAVPARAHTPRRHHLPSCDMQLSILTATAT